MAKNKNKNNTATASEDLFDKEPETVSVAPEADFEYEVVGHVTLPQLKTEEDKPVFVCFDRHIESKPKFTRTGTQATDDEGNPLAISTAQVVNLRTGEIMSMVLGTVAVKELNSNYRNDGYVGKCFRIKKCKAVNGKRYKGYEITEIRDPRTKSE